MSWRTLMKASRALDEKNQEPTKPPTIRTKPHRAGQERPQDGGFVPFVGESGGSHIAQPSNQAETTKATKEPFVLIVGESGGSHIAQPSNQAETTKARVVPICPVKIGQRVSYKYPENIRGAMSFDWAYSAGTVYEINHHLEMATISPTDEAEPWRWVPWIYLTDDTEEAHEPTLF